MASGGENSHGHNKQEEIFMTGTKTTASGLDQSKSLTGARPTARQVQHKYQEEPQTMPPFHATNPLHPRGSKFEPKSAGLRSRVKQKGKEVRPVTQLLKQPAGKKGKPGVQTAPKPTSIRVTFTSRMKETDIKYFLGHCFVPSLVNEIRIHSCECSETQSSVVVLFPSLTKARNALEVLKKKRRECPMQLELLANVYTDADVLSNEDDLWEHISRKRSTLLECHDKRIDTLRANLAKLKPKKNTYLPLEDFKSISKEREALSSKLEECLLQREEYQEYTENQLSEILNMRTRTPLAEIKRLKADFHRECNRFLAALPIYARRSHIIQTILDHQISVLVGETGSGKSTQVVQYLYDAGMAEYGLIVCTQPRKVAAITLAKHVSQEMNVELGEELGYSVGRSVKCSRNTKILYMTDHALLNECITDRILSKYSCVLVDEAHERSINTDMLLAFIKQCLPHRKDLKIIIMSATIEPELFVMYFQEGIPLEQEKTVSRVSTIKVSGRTFPVEVVYDPLQTKQRLSPENDYVMDAVEIAKSINGNEPQGDILVFLTCAPEIERACRAMEHLRDRPIVLPLHGKLPPDEQQKVFEEYSSKRKIIFSTNVAETSVTIPGVKYVVDTGLAKEMQFDPRKNMDSLEVRLISKSSAEQRKGRAGRVSAGKCYRLYSSEEYASSMPNRTNPEILRIQLSQVVLKLFEFGVPNVLTFDFVEQPDHAALEAAVETLEFVGAIQDNTLTDVGKKMAVLPLNPHLAKVLLDGVDAGMGTEALCSVAISSLAGQVFFRGGTDEMKLECDKMKLPFCHPAGDQMTNLLVYQCWQDQEMKNRTQWCVQNYVNAKSMRMVEETTKDLGHILKQRLKVKLNLKLESLKTAEFCLGKLYFDAFLNNLAVYLGHKDVGYITTAEGHSTFVIYPGSSLKALSSMPKYTIYEKMLKTSRQFMTQVMCVKQEWVHEAVMAGRLSEDPAEKFKAHIFSALDVIAVGPQIYRNIVYTQKDNIIQTIEANLPQQCIASPVMDRSTDSKEWGIVRFFTPQISHNAVEVIVKQCVREEQKKLQQQTREFGISTDHDSTRLVIGAGGSVKQVIMPYQFRTVVAVCSNEGDWVNVLKRYMNKYGEVENTQFKKCHNDFRLFVTYSTPVAAQRALSACQYPNVTLRPWHSQQFTLKIRWQRRQRGNFAFLSFDSAMHCRSAFPTVPCAIRHERYGQINVFQDKQNDECKLFLTGDILSIMNEDLIRTRIAEYIGDDIHFHLKINMIQVLHRSIWRLMLTLILKKSWEEAFFSWMMCTHII